MDVMRWLEQGRPMGVGRRTGVDDTDAGSPRRRAQRGQMVPPDRQPAHLFAKKNAGNVSAYATLQRAWEGVRSNGGSAGVDCETGQRLLKARADTAWKAGCGKSARPVWREGRGVKSSSLPYRQAGTLVLRIAHPIAPNPMILCSLERRRGGRVAGLVGRWPAEETFNACMGPVLSPPGIRVIKKRLDFRCPARSLRVHKF